MTKTGADAAILDEAMAQLNTQLYTDSPVQWSKLL